MRLKYTLLLLGLTAPVFTSFSGPAPGQETPAATPAASTEEAVRSYEVSIPDTGSEALDEALRRASALENLRESVPVDADGLIARAIGDAGNLRDALRSEGYYSGTSSVTLAGEAPDTPGLAQRLAAMPGPVPVVIRVDKGPLYHLAPVIVRAEPPGASLEDAGTVELKAGEPARAQPIIDAQDALVDRLRDTGHPFAAATRRVVVDHDTRLMEVTFRVTPGPVARFGMPVVTGQEGVNDELLANVVRPLRGEIYSQEEMDRTRRNLAALGVFGTVRARAGDRLDEAGTLPVTFTVSGRPRHAIGFSAAYETRYGPTFSTYWEHRNLFGAAERLRVEAEINRLGTGSGTNNAGGRLGVNLRQPWFLGVNQTMTYDVAALRERLKAYDRDAVTASILLERPISDRLSIGAGPLAEISRVTQDDVTTNYQLLGVLGQVRWEDVDSVLNPSRGLRVAALASPIYNFTDSDLFTRTRLQASTYLDLSGNKHTVLALRGVVGSILGAGTGDVPPDKRFYAGGGGSVRGYGYQSIGPRTRSGEPRGGRSLVEASVELRQHITGAWGMAAFVDAGSVGTDSKPNVSNLKYGAGLGVRYLTAIGPLRADIAVPLNKEPGDSGFGLYVGIGQAF
ncbi:autotransporter assembly complex protein TamA [Roseomonas marmotae]|uniref:Outer membrane protein assembly factor n=1 Tax=Roseomonas marmotae TaxID=2768161 RepID=A0ABS3KA02_9PROT|nr:autotransporter assembly complex family protein [Roseomonas marmotae]MBO1074296.1 outer membrane protein assembly factor [Roseomonas marmotae]QTI78050.1 outer membrane protein assembly factor [Roseomonas marmotae]